MINPPIIDSFLLMFVVINPFSKMFFVMSLSESVSKQDLKYLILRSNFIGFTILAIFSFVGSYILQVIFHIDISALKIAGGIVLAKIGYDYLEKGAKFVLEKEESIRAISAVPFATPLIAGPAAIATVITLSAEYGIFITVLASFLAILSNFLLMLFAVPTAEKLGHSVMSVFIRILGLFIMALGIQMIIDGVKYFLI